MGAKIQLTPAELQAQANEMLNLKEEFVSLFSGVTSELNTINSNWSPNLANNFLGKITSAQNTFTQVTDMLENGAKVANNCAVSFATVDSELSKIFSGASEAGKTFLDALVDKIKGIPEDIKSTAEILAWLEEQYGHLPDEIKDYIKDACPDGLEEAYKLASDLLQGDLSMENVYSVIDYVMDDSTKSGVIIGTFKWFFDNFDEITEMDAEMQEAFTNEILEGDLLGAVTELVEGFIDEIGGGVIEVGGNLIGDFIDGAIGNIPFGSAFVEAILGDETIGGYISEGAAYLSDGVNTVTDYLADGIDYVSDTAIDGLKKIGSWIGDLF